MRILVSALLVLVATPTLATEPARWPGMLVPLIPVAPASAPVVPPPPVVYRPIVSDPVLFRPVIGPETRYWYATPKLAEPAVSRAPIPAGACPVRAGSAGPCPAR